MYCPEVERKKEEEEEEEPRPPLWTPPQCKSKYKLNSMRCVAEYRAAADIPQAWLPQPENGLEVGRALGFRRSRAAGRAGGSRALMQMLSKWSEYGVIGEVSDHLVRLREC